MEMSYISLAYFILIILPILFVLNYLKIKVLKTTIISLSRMVVQLTMVGLYLEYLFNLDSTLLNIVYLLLMVGIASHSVGKATKLNIKKVLPILMVGLGIPVMLMLLFFTVVLLKLDNPLTAKYIIPLMGMFLGNSLQGNIISLNRFFDVFRDNEDEYLYSIGMGASKIEAITPYLREAIEASIAPTIAYVATMGLVTLPGMMTGQILGGASPMVAIKYQIAVMLAIFSCKFFSSSLCLYLSSKKFFNSFNMLEKDIFSS